MLMIMRALNSIATMVLSSLLVVLVVLIVRHEGVVLREPNSLVLWAECVLLLALFSVGAWNLFRLVGERRAKTS